jgi:hypothetical protein
MDKVWWGVKVRGGEGGIREGGGFILGGLIHSCSLREEILGALRQSETVDLQCTPGLRGFGLGGLGRP